MASRLMNLAALLAIGGIAAPARQVEAQVNIAGPLLQAGAEVAIDFGTEGGKLLLRQLSNWTAGKIESSSSNKTAVAELKRQLEWFAARDNEHAAELRKLAYRLDGTMSKDEVRALMMGSLTRMDERLATMAKRIDAQQREMAAQKQRVDSHAARFTQIDQNLAEFYKMYPRQTPSEQAAQLSADGFQSLKYGEFQVAVRTFRFAHATDPTAAEPLYGQALAQFAAGESSAAKDTVARAIVAERSRPLPRWFPRALETVQGPHREFMETARRDPLYGVYAPGMIRGTAAFLKP